MYRQDVWILNIGLLIAKCVMRAYWHVKFVKRPYYNHISLPSSIRAATWPRGLVSKLEVGESGWMGPLSWHCLRRHIHVFPVAIWFICQYDQTSCYQLTSSLSCVTIQSLNNNCQRGPSINDRRSRRMTISRLNCQAWHTVIHTSI